MAKSLEGVLVKKAHKQEKFSEEQVNDLLKCADPVDGYLHFAKQFFYIQHPVKGKLLFEQLITKKIKDIMNNFFILTI